MPEQPFASSAAASLAAEFGVDAGSVAGSGRGGRVTVADVRALAEAHSPDEPPAGLAEAGRALWLALVGDVAEDWELDRRELHLLERACVCADRLAELDAAVERDGATTRGSRGQLVVHPALSEGRMLELVQMRLLKTVELADPAEARSPASSRGKRAADARWSRKARVGAQRKAARERSAAGG